MKIRTIIGAAAVAGLLALGGGGAWFLLDGDEPRRPAAITETVSGQEKLVLSSQVLILDLTAPAGLDLSGRTTTSLLKGSPQTLRWTANSSDGFLVVKDEYGGSYGYAVRTATGVELDGYVLVRAGLQIRRHPSGQWSATTTSAWHMLEILDENRDGRIDANDYAWSTALAVFRDSNQNGAIEPTEIWKPSWYIQILNLHRDSYTTTDAYGNVRLRGVFWPEGQNGRDAVGVRLASP